MSLVSRRGGSVRIGVIACNVMKREMDQLLQEVPDIVEAIYLEIALHCYPQRMKETIKEQIRLMQNKVDVIFLGYGYCQSLKGIEDEFEIPIVAPHMDDCIQILMTPEKYASAIREEAGTWFMTPGWADAGPEMVIRELKADRVARYGKDPLEIARRLFVHYRRGLFVDTGVGENEGFVDRAAEFCKTFNLTLEQTTGTKSVLRECLKRAQTLAMKRPDQ